MPRVALDWHSVTRIVLIDVDLRKFTQIIKANSRSRIDQSAGRRDGRNKDVIPPKRIDAETIVSSHIRRVKRGWNTVRKQFATVIINPITVNAAVYEARSAARRPRIFPTTTSGASVIRQKDKRRQKLRFFG